MTPPRMPMLKLSIEHLEAGLDLARDQVVEQLQQVRRQGAEDEGTQDHDLSAERQHGRPSATLTGSAPATIAPKVATAPMTAPRWPWTIRPPV